MNSELTSGCDIEPLRLWSFVMWQKKTNTLPGLQSNLSSVFPLVCLVESLHLWVCPSVNGENYMYTAQKVGGGGNSLGWAQHLDANTCYLWRGIQKRDSLPAPSPQVATRWCQDTRTAGFSLGAPERTGWELGQGEWGVRIQLATQTHHCLQLRCTERGNSKDRL